MVSGEPSGMPSDSALAELAEALASGQLVLVAGSGVSAEAGFPTPRELVPLLVERARALGAAEDALLEIQDLAAKHQVVDALSAASDVLGPREFGAIVETALDDKRTHIPRSPRPSGTSRLGSEPS